MACLHRIIYLFDANKRFTILNDSLKNRLILMIIFEVLFFIIWQNLLFSKFTQISLKFNIYFIRKKIIG